MDNIVNKEKDVWVRPWNISKFDDGTDLSERFFALLIKGLLVFMGRTIVMYDKPIRHYFLTTGSSILYVESNGYEYCLKENTGEDWMYQERPRCQVQVSSFSVPTEELSQKDIRGTYERRCSTDGQIYGYNANIQRIPIEVEMKLNYVLSNWNEGIILTEELIHKILYQKYFTIIYLGQAIRCSVEMGGDKALEFTPVDLGGTDKNMVQLPVDIKVCTSYPSIDERTESRNDSGVMASFNYNTDEMRGGVATGADHTLAIMTRGSSVYRPEVRGYYNRLSKKFFEDAEYKNPINPDEIHIYTDIISGHRYKWNSTEFMRVYED